MSNSNNRQANTVWESFEDKRITIEMTGALIGYLLTISGLQDGFEFFRIN